MQRNGSKALRRRRRRRRRTYQRSTVVDEAVLPLVNALEVADTGMGDVTCAKARVAWVAATTRVTKMRAMEARNMLVVAGGGQQSSRVVLMTKVRISQPI